MSEERKGSGTPEGKDKKARPSIQIYRPPCRSSDSPPSESNHPPKKVNKDSSAKPLQPTKPQATAGYKPTQNGAKIANNASKNNQTSAKSNKHNDKVKSNARHTPPSKVTESKDGNNNQALDRNLNVDGRRKSKTYTKAKTTGKFDHNDNHPPANDVGKKEEKQIGNAANARRARSKTPTMQMQTNAVSKKKPSPPIARVHAIPITRPDQHITPPTKTQPVQPPFHDIRKGVSLPPAQWESIAAVIAQLDAKDLQPLTDYVKGNGTDADLAILAAGVLVEHVVEGCAPPSQTFAKTVGKTAAALLDAGTSTAATAFHAAFVHALDVYFEQRTTLRNKNMRYWVTLLTFTSDTFSSLGMSYEGKLVNVLLNILNFMLLPPTRATLRIEELESLISVLLSIGHDLERHSPDDVAALRDAVRDAFLANHEPWSRKMLLLLVELSASGWKLPQEATDYFFGAVEA